MQYANFGNIHYLRFTDASGQCRFCNTNLVKSEVKRGLSALEYCKVNQDLSVTNTSVVDIPVSDNFLLAQSRKESKRLLKVAKANAGTLSIHKLHNAQELVAQMKGKDSWRELVVLEHKPLEEVEPDHPFMVVLDEYGYYAHPYETVREVENDVLFSTLTLTKGNVLTFNALIDALDKEFSEGVRSITMVGFELPQVLQAHVYAGLTSGAVIVADGIVDYHNSRRDPGKSNDFVKSDGKYRVNNRLLPVMVGGRDYQTVRDYLASQCGSMLYSTHQSEDSLYVNFNLLSPAELAVVALLACGLCNGVHHSRLMTMLFTGHDVFDIQAESMSMIKKCIDDNGWDKIAVLVKKHRHVRTFILALDKLSPNGRRSVIPCNMIYNLDPVLWWAIVDCKGDSCGINVAGIIATHLYEAFEEKGPNERMDVITRNILGGFDPVPGEPDRDSVDLLPVNSDITYEFKDHSIRMTNDLSDIERIMNEPDVHIPKPASIISRISGIFNGGRQA